MKASWIVLLAAPAVALAYDQNTLVPAGPLRHWVSGLAAILILVMAVGLPSRLPKPITRVGLALGAWLVLATLTGVDRWHGLVGTPDRRFGLITWLLTLGAVTAGSRLIEHKRQAALGATAAAGLIGLVALAQLFGWSPSGSALAGDRWSGLWGQPAFLASAAILFGFVSAGQALESENPRPVRLAGAFGAAGCAVALVGSGTRGAMVGAVAGTAIWILLRQPGRKPIVWLGLATAGAAAFVIGQGRDFTRLDEWEIGLRAVADSPVLGYGPEGYRTVFGRFVTLDYRRAHGSAVITDRAHNGLIDMALVGGIVAVVLFLLGVGLAARIVWRRRGRLSATDISMAAAIGAYLVAQQALFPIAALEPLVGLYLGFIVSGAPANRDHRAVRGVAARVALGIIAAFVAVSGASEAIAERSLSAEAATNVIDTKPVLTASALRPDSIRVRYASARLLAAKGGILDLDQALAQLESGLGWSPHDPALNQLYLHLLVQRALLSKSEVDRSAAWDQAQAVIDADPLNASSLGSAAAAARMAGETTIADNLTKQAEAASQEIPAD